MEGGRKTFEVRRNDRGFEVGDVLWLREYLGHDAYTGRSCRRRVSYVLDGGSFGIEDGFAVLGLEPTQPKPDLLEEAARWCEEAAGHCDTLHDYAIKCDDERTRAAQAAAADAFRDAARHLRSLTANPSDQTPPPAPQPTEEESR